MGFFKRLFSIGSKKNHKTKSKRSITPNIEQFTPVNDEEHEAAIGKLLRSTSAKFAETSELDYAALPPIPHPINKIIQTPASSTISLGSDSLFQRGTYNVTVHRRRTHASTEFPHANRDFGNVNNDEHGGFLPVEDSRILGLRSDPSVVSLLELYDEHGRVGNDAFANDESLPIQDGHAQVRRNGSTFRQLLGGPFNSGNDNSEGDISWAERYLAESDATSVSSSSCLRTPEIFTGGVTAPEVSVTSDPDLSFTTLDDPAVSSMEVEVNNSYDTSQDLNRSSKNNSPYTSLDPMTPQRASQIFDFLTKQKQSKPPVDLDGALPDPPSCFSSPSEEGTDSHRRSFENRDSLAHIPFNPTRFSAPPASLDNDTQRISRARSSLIDATPLHGIRHSQELQSAFSDVSHDETIATPFHPQPFVKQSFSVEDAKRNDVQILMSGPTRVILTAPTPGTNHVGPSRLLSGPRRPNRKPSSGSIKKRRSVLGEVLSNSSAIAGDPFLIVSPKPKSRDRRSSTSSTRSLSRREYERNETYISHPKRTRPSSPAPNVNTLKENQLSLSVKNELPSTPLRSNTNASSRSLFKNVVQLGMVRTPAHRDPNLSSELSPVGRQIMDDVRHQRMRAKEAVRARLGNRF